MEGVHVDAVSPMVRTIITALGWTASHFTRLDGGHTSVAWRVDTVRTSRGRWIAMLLAS